MIMLNIKYMQKQESTGRSASTRVYDIGAASSYDEMIKKIEGEGCVTGDRGCSTTYHSTPQPTASRKQYYSPLPQKPAIKTTMGEIVVIVVGVLLLICVLVFLLF